jgi:hypothetical protein
MRGDDNLQEGIFSYISPEKRVPADHPLRPIRKMVDEILKEMSPQFAKLYSCQFRLKIPHCTGRKFPTPELHK